MKHNKSIKSLITINEREDCIVNIVKAKYRLKNKSEAIKYIIKEYEETKLEPELRPGFIDKLGKIRKEKHHRFSNINELRRMIENV